MVNVGGRVDDWAGDLAQDLLGFDENRWSHVRAVAAKARMIGEDLGRDDRALLVASAYLHDIGYAAQARSTGFHALDGACFVRDLGRDRIAGLVANHSGAVVEAGLRGLSEPLSAFPDERTEVRDMLWYCDLTTGPTGANISLPDRLADVASRYGPDHVVTRSLTRAYPSLTEVVDRVQLRMRSTDLDISG